MPTQIPTDDTLYVKSGILPDGSYGSSLELTADLSIPLDADTTDVIATHIERVCAETEFLAKCMKQMIGIGVPEDDSLWNTLAEIRSKIPEDHSVDHLPVRTRGGLTRDGKPFMVVVVNGEDTGQLDLGPALNWASHIRSARHWSNMDQLYYELLTSEFDVESAVAHNTVAALSEISVAEPPPSNARQFFPDRLI